MVDPNGKHIVKRLERLWILNVLVSYLLISVAVSIVVVALLHAAIQLPVLWVIPVFVFCFIFLLLTKSGWQINESDVLRFLNRQYPQLEESAHLIVKPYESLNFLQKLQRQKTGRALAELKVTKKFYSQRNSATVYLIFGLLFSAYIAAFSSLFTTKISEGSGIVKAGISPPLPVERILPEIRSVSVQITPPAYTNKPSRSQSQFNLLVEEGGDVTWHVRTNVPVKKISLVFNDKQVLQLTPEANNLTSLTGKKLITKSGFYQVFIDDKVSEFYKIEIIKDLPPVITIQTPQQRTVIDFGMPEKVLLAATLSDDYGVSETVASATIASGSGEAVKFKEQQLPFAGFIKDQTKYNLRKLLDLKALGLQPGDELYFYIKAIDNHNQEKRSDVYIITLADTAQLMSMDGLLNGIDLKPEYFRSERQIIIETEQLLKARDTINQQEFNNRSNDLGIDQKLLRLRYGKFLGEENETDIGRQHNHDDADQNDAADFGNAAKVVDEYADKHDNAEDATFFEPELKAQLKATLNEMWKAELQLRTNNPNDALPFEYKALRLLKDLQQKSRVYVAKTGLKTMPLKPEKRLTGDLTKIIGQVNKVDIEKKKYEYEVSRKTVGLLELVRSGQQISNQSIETLRKANLQLYAEAEMQPEVYLPAVTAMNKISKAVSKGQQPKVTDVNAAESGLQKLLSLPPNLPFSGNETSYKSLSGEYFKNINKDARQ